MSEPVDSEKASNLETYTNERTNTYKITFKGNNSYKVTPHITDLAGNTASGAAQEFVMDDTAPEVTVTYNDDKLELHNGKYFNQQRTATVEIKERNFNAENLGFTLIMDGVEKNYNKFSDLSKDIRSWADCNITEIVDSQAKEKNPESYTDERTQTFTITFGKDGKDHDYKFSVNATDLAGNSNNKIVIDKSAKVKTGDDFTVDMVAPVLNLTYNTTTDVTKDIIENSDCFYTNAKKMSVKIANY